jgi:hypothetical protein
LRTQIFERFERAPGREVIEHTSCSCRPVAAKRSVFATVFERSCCEMRPDDMLKGKGPLVGVFAAVLGVGAWAR